MKSIHWLFLAYLQSFSATDTDKEIFNRLDKNHDGFVSAEEAKDDGRILRKWVEIDTNSNEQLEIVSSAHLK